VRFFRPTILIQFRYMQVGKNELQTKTLKITIFTLLFILSLNSIFAFSTNDTLQLKNEFKELTIRYQYGDESYTVEEMKFVKNGNKIIATISIPNNEQLEQSETELTKINISSIDKFLTKAFEFKDDCAEKWTSSYVNYYTLDIDEKQIKIYKFCNWEESNFMELKKQIFGNYLIKLEEKRKQLNIENNELLIGLWKYDNSIHKVEKDKIYTLTRLENKSKENCFLKFKKDQKLVDHYCLKNSKTKYDFRFDIINGDLILYINGENKNDRKDFVYGYIFKVLELNKSTIKLTTWN
jgi:hypothetical protein